MRLRFYSKHPHIQKCWTKLEWELPKLCLIEAAQKIQFQDCNEQGHLKSNHHQDMQIFWLGKSGLNVCTQEIKAKQLYIYNTLAYF